MCDHLGGVGGREDSRRQVHHGLHLQGDTHDEDEECATPVKEIFKHLIIMI